MDHLKAALYALHYIHSTHDYGISFTSDSVAPMHSYVHFPPSTDVEAYSDAIPPTPATSSTLSSYSDACWGSQIGSAIADGTYFPLFKFRSMSGGLSFGMADLLASSANAKTLHLSAPAKLKYVPLMPPQKRLLTFAISVPVCVQMVILFLILHSQLFSTMIMMLASNGHTT